MLTNFRDEIIQHYKNPHNFGSLTSPSVKVFETNSLCGDNIELFLIIKNKKITDCKFRSLGCAISTATASMLTDKLKGLSISEAKKISENNILELLGNEISPARKKCAFLPLSALNKALKDL